MILIQPPPQYAISDGCIAIINIHYVSKTGRIASDGTVRDLGRHRTLNDTNPAAPSGRIAGDDAVCDNAPGTFAKYAATCRFGCITNDSAVYDGG